MLVVMHRDAGPQQIHAVVQAIQDLGYQAHPMPGAQRTAVCITGNSGVVPPDTLAGLPGVTELIRVSKPYKLVSREFRPEDTRLTIAGVTLGGEDPVMIAGPCSVESERTTLGIAGQLAELGVRLFRAGAFKPRTSPYSFQGLGQVGLDILATVKQEYGMGIVTEAVDTESLPRVAEVADIIQVGARNMHNTSLLKKLGTLSIPVLLKRGMSATLDELLMAAEYIMSAGNYQVILCERGIRTFADHSRFTLDVAAVAAMKQLSHLPVLADPSHAAGVSRMVGPLAMAATAAGADGLIIEVHDQPAAAWCDGAQAIHPQELAALMSQIHKKRGQEQLT